MTTYVVLFRGINVGGKNIIPMAQLKLLLLQQGFRNVTSYIQSGNVVLQSELPALEVKQVVETLIPANFSLSESFIRVLVLSRQDYQLIVNQIPENFGIFQETYRYNVLFPIDVNTSDIAPLIQLRDGVDQMWIGDKALYFMNLRAADSRSFLSKIIQKSFYKSITIRNWNTTKKLLEICENV